jgi:hypothetical protein
MAQAEDDVAHFDAIADKRTADKTKNNYGTAWKHFVRYCKEFHEDIVDDDNQIDLTKVDVTVFKQFFSHVSRKRAGGPFGPAHDPPQYNSPGYMGSYRCFSAPHIAEISLYVYMCVHVWMHANA